MFAEVRQARRAQLVDEHDHMRDPELFQVRKGGVFGKRPERCGFAIVARRDEARVAVDERLPETRRREQTVCVLEFLEWARKGEAGDQLAITRPQTIKDWRDAVEGPVFNGRAQGFEMDTEQQHDADRERSPLDTPIEPCPSETGEKGNRCEN